MKTDVLLYRATECAKDVVAITYLAALAVKIVRDKMLAILHTRLQNLLSLVLDPFDVEARFCERKLADLLGQKVILVKEGWINPYSGILRTYRPCKATGSYVVGLDVAVEGGSCYIESAWWTIYPQDNVLQSVTWSEFTREAVPKYTVRHTTQRR